MITDKLPPKILILESDEILRTSISNTIERYWFNAIRCQDLENALRVLPVENPNVMIISTRVQGSDPLDAALTVRKTNVGNNIPIVFILDNIEQKESFIIAESNLEEYVVRPFSPSELMIAVKNLLRKTKPTFQDKVIRYKDLSMDLAKFKVQKGNKNIHLGPTEFKILQLLMQSPRNIFSRKQIIEYVWGADNNIEARTVDVHVNRLRTLLRSNMNELPAIKTVRAAGYCLSLPGEID